MREPSQIVDFPRVQGIIARFEGGDPAKVDETISGVRLMMDEGSRPPGLEDARRSMMVVDRQSGTGLGLTFFDTEDPSPWRPRARSGPHKGSTVYEYAPQYGDAVATVDRHGNGTTNASVDSATGEPSRGKPGGRC